MAKNIICAPNILLPKVDDMTKWSVIACDQFTSEQDYWTKLENYVGDAPSTLNLIYPEIYLGADNSKRITEIENSMKNYLDGGIFKVCEKGFILTVRKTKFVPKRLGIILSVDLEEYEYKKGSTTPIRATEATIEERIPPRLQIRKNASIELPHTMLLYDDEKKSIAEKLYQERATLEKVYDFELNMDGGHVEGYFVKDYEWVINAFNGLLGEENMLKKYGNANDFLFAVGDGNHSLATAKAHWENVKKGLTEQEKFDHPARFALVEVVNVYDEGIYFEPIFRFVSDVNVEEFLEGLTKKDIGVASIVKKGGKERLDGKNSLPDGILACDGYIKEYIEKVGGKVDYIHGEQNLQTLVNQTKNSVGITFEKLDKGSLFEYVVKNGSLPKKTFSMGEAIEKRYYLESKKIIR